MTISPTQSLINRIASLFIDHCTCNENWGFVLFSEELQQESELRNRAFCIWFSSLLDTVEARTNTTKLYGEAATALEAEYLLSYLEFFDYFADVTADFMSIFNKSEQISIYNFRDSLVHSFLKGQHESTKRIKYIQNGALMNENISHSEYHSLVSWDLSNGKSFDQAVEKLRNKVYQGPMHRYWNLLNFIRKNRMSFYETMKAGTPLRIQGDYRA